MWESPRNAKRPRNTGAVQSAFDATSNTTKGTTGADGRTGAVKRTHRPRTTEYRIRYMRHDWIAPQQRLMQTWPMVLRLRRRLRRQSSWAPLAWFVVDERDVGPWHEVDRWTDGDPS